MKTEKELSQYKVNLTKEAEDYLKDRNVEALTIMLEQRGGG